MIKNNKIIKKICEIRLKIKKYIYKKILKENLKCSKCHKDFHPDFNGRFVTYKCPYCKTINHPYNFYGFGTGFHLFICAFYSILFTILIENIHNWLILVFIFIFTTKIILYLEDVISIKWQNFIIEKMKIDYGEEKENFKNNENDKNA